MSDYRLQLKKNQICLECSNVLMLLILPVTSDNDISAPDIMKSDFLGTFIANRGPNNDATNMNIPTAIAPSLGESTVFPEAACKNNNDCG